MIKTFYITIGCMLTISTLFSRLHMNQRGCWPILPAYQSSSAQEGTEDAEEQEGTKERGSDRLVSSLDAVLAGLGSILAGRVPGRLRDGPAGV
jgi:hypothetical protein